MRRRCFNPHPAWKPDATMRWRAHSPHAWVSILTRLGSRMRPSPEPFAAVLIDVSILTRLGSRMRPDIGSAGRAILVVSILTRLGSRMRHRRQAIPIIQRIVSILTRLGSRMRPRPARTPAHSRRSFNPHPAWKPDATLPSANSRPRRRRFQSSPGLEAGCDPGPGYHFGPRVSVSILTRLGSRMRHRASGDGWPWSRFQSSPGLEAGCDAGIGLFDIGHILFQSSSGLEAGCDRRSRARSRGRFACFNPHPAWKPDATVKAPACVGMTVDVSILTRLGSRMRPASPCD